MISVIVPVYNIGKYLHRCLDSLICQKNSDFEVIIVNDGSKDDSKFICEEYCKRDKRFNLINKINGGVSSARNTGLVHAKGEWVVFIDGDDKLDDNFLTLPSQNIEYIDVIEKSFIIEDEQDETLKNIIEHDELINGQKPFIQYYSSYILNNSATLCNKIIRRKIIGNNQFDLSKKMGEDFLFFLSIINRIQKYYRSSVGTYYYIRRSQSASRVIDADYLGRVHILFENLYSVKKITRENGVKELGQFLVFNLYLPYLLRLNLYLRGVEWIKITCLSLSALCTPNSLVSVGDRKRIAIAPLKLMVKRLIGKKL